MIYVLFLFNIPISEAKIVDSNGIPVKLGQQVEVSGVVTSSQYFGAYGPAFIQDNTGGIALYGDEVSSLKDGDSVNVVGIVDNFYGLTELKDISITKLGIGQIQPKEINISDINENNEGFLVKLNNVVFIENGIFEDNTSYKLIKDEDTITVYTDKDTDIPGAEIPSDTIDITGILSQHDVYAPYNEGYQLMPRKLNDLSSLPTGEIIPIKDLYTGNYIGKTVSITGCATVADSIFDYNYLNIFIEDSSGGINIFSFDMYDINIGDSLLVSGMVDTFKGKYELKPDNINILKNNCLFDTTSTKCNKAYDHMGELVLLKDVTIDSKNLEGDKNYTISDNTGSVTLRIDKDTDIPGLSLTNDTVNIIGIVSFYNEVEILPRFRTDIQNKGTNNDTSSILPIKEVQKHSALSCSSLMEGKKVKIKGIITCKGSFIGSKNLPSFFVQDSTAGINIFAPNYVNIPNGYDSLGWLTEIEGIVKEYKGITEITNSEIHLIEKSALPQPTKLNAGATITEDMEGQLVELNGVKIITEPDEDASGANYLLNNGGAVINLRIKKETNIPYDSVQLNKFYNIIGIASQYSDNGSCSDGYQILPRSINDIKSLYTDTSTQINLKVDKKVFYPDEGERIEINYSFPPLNNADLSVYTINGRKLKSILKNTPGGTGTVYWNGLDEFGNRLQMGIYIIVLKIYNNKTIKTTITIGRK